MTLNVCAGGAHSHRANEHRGKRTGTGRAWEAMKEPGEVALGYGPETRGLSVQLAEWDGSSKGTGSEIFG